MPVFYRQWQSHTHKKEEMREEEKTRAALHPINLSLLPRLDLYPLHAHNNLVPCFVSLWSAGGSLAHTPLITYNMKL